MRPAQGEAGPDTDPSEFGQCVARRGSILASRAHDTFALGGIGVARLRRQTELPPWLKRFVKVSIGIIIAAVCYNIVVVLDPFNRFAAVEELPPQVAPTYATGYCLSMGLPQPPAGSEWVARGTWSGSDGQLLTPGWLSSRWGVIWHSGRFDERAADPDFRQLHPGKATGRFAIARGATEIGISTVPGETGTCIGDDSGRLEFVVTTGNLDWTVSLYEMQQIHY